MTKSTPFGSIDAPFNPISLALGAEATFVARTIDTDKQHLPTVLRAAAAHEGAALVEIYQNCPVFNDGAFDALRDKKQGEVNRIYLEHGEPIRGRHGVRVPTASCGSGASGDAGHPRRASRRSVVRVRALAAVLLAGRADADRDLPRRRAPGLGAGADRTSWRVARAGADDATLDAVLRRRGHVDDLLARRSEKWTRRTRRTCCRRGWRRWTSTLAPPVKAALRAAIEHDDAGLHRAPIRRLLEAFADFAARRLDWKVDPAYVSRSPT